MDRPGCLTWNGQNLPLKGWGKINDSWLECWMLAYDCDEQFDEYRFACMFNQPIIEWRHEFTTTDPIAKQMVDYDRETLPTPPFCVVEKSSGDKLTLLTAHAGGVVIYGRAGMSYPRLREHFTHADGSELGAKA